MRGSSERGRVAEWGNGRGISGWEGGELSGEKGEGVVKKKREELGEARG